jgi:hypothetical protein
MTCGVSRVGHGCQWEVIETETWGRVSDRVREYGRPAEMSRDGWAPRSRSACGPLGQHVTGSGATLPSISLCLDQRACVTSFAHSQDLFEIRNKKSKPSWNKTRST